MDSEGENQSQSSKKVLTQHSRKIFFSCGGFVLVMELYCCVYSWIFLARVCCRCEVKKAQDAAVLILQLFPTQILQG